MSTNQLLKKTDLTHLSRTNNEKSVTNLISWWLSEMDGDTTEEDGPVYTQYIKLDGKNSHPSFKKVFDSSPSTIYHKR